MTPVLSFKNGKFVLRDFDSELNTYWEIIDRVTAQTSSLKAAVAFKSYSDSQARKVIIRASQEHYPLPRLPQLSFLDPHQIKGVKWSLIRKRSYLAHAPGAGKTAQAIVISLLSKGKGQTLFIVPPSLITNWEREIVRFTEPFGVWPAIGIITTSTHQHDVAWRADFIICPDSMLTKPWVYEGLSRCNFKVIAVDEASRFKDPTAERSRAFYGGTSNKGYQYHGLFQEARHVVLLDGSPMPNRPMELWAPTYALYPQAIRFMEQTDFGFKYCGATMNKFGQWEFNHSSNEAELKARLQKDFMHVVNESELSHPERRRSILFIDQDVRSAEHKSWERQHLTHLKLSDLDEGTSQGQLAKFRRELGLRKVPWSAQYIGERLRTKSESILVFAWHREVCEELARKLSVHGPGLVIGGTKHAKREEYFRQFQSGKRRLIIGNIAAMGRGHNLQRADRVIFVEPSWTDELNKQCEKRASRRGRNQAAFVRCEYLAAPGSMDEPILNSLFTKANRVKRVIG